MKRTHKHTLCAVRTTANASEYILELYQVVCISHFIVVVVCGAAGVPLAHGVRARIARRFERGSGTLHSGEEAGPKMHYNPVQCCQCLSRPWPGVHMFA
jgi:hypothetical protein